jgi:hypothetical protein
MTVINDMLETHPAQGHINAELLADCMKACFECVQACTICADACLSEDDVNSLTRCVRTNLNCADICDATGQVLGRPADVEWEVTYKQLQACMAACAVCAAECEHHLHHEHCKVCARVCRQCEKACQAVLNTLPSAQ